MAAAVAVHIAALVDHSKTLAPGEIGTVAVIAASRDQANTVLGYIRGFLMSSPLLAGQVESITRDEIMLKRRHLHQRDDQHFPHRAGQTILGCRWGRDFVLEERGHC